ncbi:MAG: response regulator [Alkalispirochaeta sp.]
MTGNPPSILLVEDEAIIALAEQRMLERNGYHVRTAHTGEAAIRTVEEKPLPDLILMDIDLGRGMKGTEAAERILQKHAVPLVFLSSHTEPEIVDLTEGITSYGYVVKNSGETVLLASIRMAFRLHSSYERLQHATDDLRETTEELRIANEELQVAYEEIQVANEELRETNEHLLWWDGMMRYVISHDTTAIAVLDDALHFMYVSDRWLQDYQCWDTDIVGRHHYEVFPEIPEKWRDVHRRALAGEIITAESDQFIRNGSVIRTTWQCRPWYRYDGSVGGIVLYTHVLSNSPDAIDA